MAILNEFEYFKPKKLNELLEILYDYKNCSILAGGTDLINELKQESKIPANVIDIKGVKSLSKIKFSKRSLSLGSNVTFTDILEHEDIGKRFPLFNEMAIEVASVGVRNRATLVGNICSAVPSLDSGPLLMVFDTTIHVQDYYEKREIPIAKWFKAPRKTALKRKELVTSISIKMPTTKFGSCFLKLKRYKGEDLAQVNIVSVALPENQYRVSFGAVAATPIRAKKIEALLNGNELSAELIAKAEKLLEEEISPITDIRSSSEYRMHMAKVMLRRSLKFAVDRLNGNGPEYGSVAI